MSEMPANELRFRGGHDAQSLTTEPSQMSANESIMGHKRNGSSVQASSESGTASSVGKSGGVTYGRTATGTSESEHDIDKVSHEQSWKADVTTTLYP